MSDIATTPLTLFVHPSRLTSGCWDGERIAGQGDICASYSADRISEEKPVRAPFLFEGNLWVCVGMMGCGGGVQKYAHAYRLLPEKSFTGEVTTYSARTATGELCEAARNDPMGGYHGVTVRHKGGRFVLCGPQATFIADKQKPPEQTHPGAQLDLF